MAAFRAMDRAAENEPLITGLVALQAELTSLKDTLESNRRIALATGIVMASRRVSEEQALAMLQERSRRENRKVCDLADEVVVSGRFQPAPDSSS